MTLLVEYPIIGITTFTVTIAHFHNVIMMAIRYLYVEVKIN